MNREELLELAVQALREIVDAWTANNAEGDDYDEGFDDGLKHCSDIASNALKALAAQENEHG